MIKGQSWNNNAGFWSTGKTSIYIYVLASHVTIYSCSNNTHHVSVFKCNNRLVFSLIHRHWLAGGRTSSIFWLTAAYTAGCPLCPCSAVGGLRRGRVAGEMQLSLEPASATCHRMKSCHSQQAAVIHSDNRTTRHETTVCQLPPRGNQAWSIITMPHP